MDSWYVNKQIDKMKFESNLSDVLVSIITVCRNAKNVLGPTIESILDQTYPNIQYIIIDGDSTDDTVDFVNSMYKDRIDTFVSEKDNGIYDAMNKGVALSSGEIIGLLNAGDTYSSGAIENVVKAYLNNNKKQAVYYGGINKTKNGKVVQTYLSEDCRVDNIVNQMSVYHTATFIPRSLYEKLGVYDYGFRISGDFDLLRRFYLKKVDFIDMHFVTTNMAEGGVSEQFRSIHRFAAESSMIQADGRRNFKYYFKYVLHISVGYLSFFKKKILGSN